jgi:hypothetical protein
LLEAEGALAETKQDIIRSFAMQRSGRKEVKQPVGHIPIAFSPEDKHSEPKLPSIGGVELMSEQWQTLKEGGHIYLENINRSNGDGKFSSCVFLDEEKNKALFSKDNPDEFIKYGKYEMRIRDKILIENGYVTKAKVKWRGTGSYANPYLWKENKADAETEYKESWDDPRLPKPPKEEQKPKQPVIQQKNRGQKR